jgi:hypothetical protein
LRYRVPFVIGISVGLAVGVRYVAPTLGVLQRRIRDLRERPDLQEAAGLVSAQAGLLVDRARGAVLHRGPADSAAGTGPIRQLNGSSVR